MGRCTPRPAAHYDGRMRKLTALVLTFTVLGLFGCSPKPEPLDVAEGQRRLEAALSDLPHVTRAEGVQYTMQGAFRPDSAWMKATLRSDSDDDAVNHEILREAARRIVEAMHDNHPKHSSVNIEVVRPDGRAVRYIDAGFPASPSLDELAEHLDVPR